MPGTFNTINNMKGTINTGILALRSTWKAGFVRRNRRKSRNSGAVVLRSVYNAPIP